MQFCSVFSKSPVNVLSYFHNLKKKRERERKKIKTIRCPGRRGEETIL